jgi:aspartate/methionine/tyrosine aminotransferase
MMNKIRLAQRMDEIQPFYVMELLKEARYLEAEGKKIIHMEIGEPDFITPEPVINAAINALRKGMTRYTPALGLPQLREKLSEYYKKHYGVTVSSERIIITPGASGALQVVMGVLINPGDNVVITDPGYPCNRHFVRLMEGVPLAIPVGPATEYQLAEEHIDRFYSEHIKAVILTTPSNPTGTIISLPAMKKILSTIDFLHGYVIVDEIYQGLVYDQHSSTVLSLSDNVFVINSFSKYFGMTGWRVGWLVVPKEFVRPVEKLAQNIFIATSTVSQYGALAALERQTLSLLEERRNEFRQRRDYLLPELRKLGFDIPVTPEGAFYIYSRCSRFTQNSFAFAMNILKNAGVAITPGLDFGAHDAQYHVRFAYTTCFDNLREGVRRLRETLRVL